MGDTRLGGGEGRVRGKGKRQNSISVAPSVHVVSQKAIT